MGIEIGNVKNIVIRNKASAILAKNAKIILSSLYFKELFNSINYKNQSGHNNYGAYSWVISYEF